MLKCTFCMLKFADAGLRSWFVIFWLTGLKCLCLLCSCVFPVSFWFLVLQWRAFFVVSVCFYGAAVFAVVDFEFVASERVRQYEFEF